MDNCPICNRKVLPNGRQAKCCVCSKSYHLKCISLSADVQNYIQTNASIWYCSKCVVEILPFNHIEDDDTFISEVNNMDINTQTLESLSELLFNPFELNTDDQYSPLYDIDPDVHFYNELDSHIGLKCNYYFEDMVSTAIEDNFKGRSYHSVFSICHMNIRSLKANLASFETCLENVDIPFTVIGISETWLRDCNCDLYDIMGYNLIENHRHNKMGGGVGIFLKSNISFQIRSDLGHHESYESVFVEIEK